MDVDSLHIGMQGSVEGGRFAPWVYYDRESAAIVHYVCTSDQLDYYVLPKKLNRTVLLAPYQTKNAGKEIYFISIAQPLMDHGFKGVIGTDWFWEDFNDVMSEKPYGKNSLSYLITGEGQVLSHEDDHLLGTIADTSVIQQINGLGNEETITIEHLEGAYRVIAQLDLPYTENKWYLVNEIPDSNDFFTVARSSEIIWRVGFFSVVFIGMITFLLIYFILKIIKDKNKVDKQLESSIESSLEGVIVIGEDRTYHKVNSEYTRGVKNAFKIPLEVGDNIYDSLPEKYHQFIGKLVEKAFKGYFFSEKLTINKSLYRLYFNPIMSDRGCLLYTSPSPRDA